MTTWVMLRGLGREAAHWHDVPTRLAGATGARVLTPDLPGVGQARDRTPPWTIEGIARDVAVRVAEDPLIGRGPVHVLGHSLGGMVALRWAALAAAGADVPSVDRLALIASSLGRFSPPWRRMGLGMLPSVGRTACTRSPRGREALVLDMTSTISGPAREAILDEREIVARARPMRPSVVIRQLTAAARERGPRTCDVPLTVLVGRGDRFVHPSCSHRIAEAYGGTLHEHPTAGHDIPLDAPDWLVERLSA